MKTKHSQRIQLRLDSKDLTNSRFLTYLVGLVTQMVMLTKTSKQEVPSLILKTYVCPNA